MTTVRSFISDDFKQLKQIKCMFYILYRNGDNCLSTSEPSDYIPDVPLFLREQSAEVLDIDDQCRYIHGSESFLCRVSRHYT
jgi:hypothetical protein